MTEQIATEKVAWELGQKFKAARENLGRDYAAVAKDICVSKCYLEAIDEGRLDELPGRTFAIGFIRSYAQSLKMDSEEAIILYKEATTPVEEVEENAIVNAGGAPMTMDKMRGEKTHGFSEDPIAVSSARRAKPRGKLNYSILGGFFAVVALVATAGSYIPSGSGSTSGGNNTLGGGANVPPSAEMAPVSTTPGVAIPSDAAKAESIILTAREDAWIRVVADDKELFNGVLRAGESYQPSSFADARFTTSNAGGLTLLAGGEDMGFLGARGDILIDVVLTDPAFSGK